MRLGRYALTVVIALAPGLALAHDDGGAERFVRGLYGAYHGRGPDYLGRNSGAVFSPSLLKLIRRDAAETPRGDVGTLDGDPICDCQDFGDLRKVEVTIARGADGHALATVHFRISAEPRTVRLDLVAVRGHWRVTDVHTADTPSLVSLLTESLDRRKSKE